MRSTFWTNGCWMTLSCPWFGGQMALKSKVSEVEAFPLFLGYLGCFVCFFVRFDDLMIGYVFKRRILRRSMTQVLVSWIVSSYSWLLESIGIQVQDEKKPKLMFSHLHIRYFYHDIFRSFFVTYNLDMFCAFLNPTILLNSTCSQLRCPVGS